MLFQGSTVSISFDDIICQSYEGYGDRDNRVAKVMDNDRNMMKGHCVKNEIDEEIKILTNLSDTIITYKVLDNYMLQISESEHKTFKLALIGVGFFDRINFREAFRLCKGKSIRHCFFDSEEDAIEWLREE